MVYAEHIHEEMSMAETNWNLWRKCTICSAAIGEPCWTRTGSIAADSRPRLVPHKSRKPRTKR